MPEEQMPEEEKLYQYFYAIPNSHFNSFFEAATGASEPHPLADLVASEEGEPKAAGESVPTPRGASKD